MTPSVEVDDTVASLNEGDTSSNLNILDNDTDLPDNGSTLSVYSVGGTVFNSLTDSTNLTYTSGDGYKEVAGSYGTSTSSPMARPITSTTVTTTAD